MWNIIWEKKQATWFSRSKPWGKLDCIVILVQKNVKWTQYTSLLILVSQSRHPAVSYCLIKHNIISLYHLWYLFHITLTRYLSLHTNTTCAIFSVIDCIENDLRRLKTWYYWKVAVFVLLLVFFVHCNGLVFLSKSFKIIYRYTLKKRYSTKLLWGLYCKVKNLQRYIFVPYLPVIGAY